MSFRGDGGRGRGDRGRGGRGGRGGGDGYGSSQRGRGGGDAYGTSRGGGGGGAAARGRGGAAAIQVYCPPGVPLTVDKVVSHTEDTTKPSLEADPRQGHPPRPGYGTKGSPVVLWANCVQIVPDKALILHRYHVTVEPEANGKKLGRIIELVLESPQLMGIKGDIVTDFRSTLICRKKLDSDKMQIPVIYRGDKEDTATANAATFSVHIQHTNDLPVSELIEHINSTRPVGLADAPAFLQAFNIFLNHYAKSRDGQVQIGTSKTFLIGQNSPTYDLTAGLTAIRGFFSSVRLATSRILVNVNVSHAAFYNDVPLPKLMSEFNIKNPSNTESLSRFLTKLAVRTTHLPKKTNSAGQEIPRVKRIIGLATLDDGKDLRRRPLIKRHGANANEVQFWLDEKPFMGSSMSPQASSKGKKAQHQASPGPAAGSTSSAGRYITVAEYFRQVYNKQLNQPGLPVVNTGTVQNPIYLPPEVCHVMPGQSASARLDPLQTQHMIKFAVRKPWDNAAYIVNEGLQMVGLNPSTNKMLNQFGIKVVGNLVTVPGRVLDSPRVQYKQGNPLNTQFGSWNLRDVSFVKGGTMGKWSCALISLDTHVNPLGLDKANQLMKSLCTNLQKAGIQCQPPLEPKEWTVNSVDELDNKMRVAAANISALFVILPANHTPLYNKIKQLGDVKYGLHTICSVAGTLQRQGDRLDQYFANVALKFNLKFGGINHRLDTTRMPLIAQGKTMLVGIDVTHPSPGSASTAPSVAGMVGSIDKSLSQFPAALCIQTARQENVDDLTPMLESRLKLWRANSPSGSALPENIIVYRDGVSEGQYDTVLNFELPRLRQAAANLYTDTLRKAGLPRFTIIIVGKRHHTRFYPTAERDADRSGNTRPGTVVDRGVTRAAQWDFFLQPHAALQGTARPGHYYVVLDEVFRHHYGSASGGPQRNVADIVEEFTHSLCYLFGRATKAVSLCPPAYYADIVCERARCYLSRVFEAKGTPNDAPPVVQADVEVHGKLRDSMFYI